MKINVWRDWRRRARWREGGSGREREGKSEGRRTKEGVNEGREEERERLSLRINRK